MTKVQQLPYNVMLRFLLSDPVLHWGVFAVLSGLLCVGFYHSGMNPIPLYSRKLLTGQAIIKVILLGIGYVLFIEIYQAIIPWRSFGFDDILWGSVGVVSGSILVWLKEGK